MRGRHLPAVVRWDDGDYKVPFNFTVKINKVTIALDPPKLTPDDVEKLKAAERAAQDAN